LIVAQRFLLAALIAAAACGGGPPAPAPVPADPVVASNSAMKSFMRAVEDSNIAGMSAVWGSSRGAASSTHQPSDYEKRMVVAQLFLRAAPFTILENSAVEGQPGQRRLRLQLDRGRCKREVPVTVVRTDKGDWVIQEIDLNQAGTPARPCDPIRTGP
jgi:hypothetical protein